MSSLYSSRSKGSSARSILSPSLSAAISASDWFCSRSYQLKCLLQLAPSSSINLPTEDVTLVFLSAGLARDQEIVYCSMNRPVCISIVHLLSALLVMFQYFSLILRT